MPVHQERTQRVAVGPFFERVRQAHRRAEVRCVGAAQVTLGQHVQKPPGQAVTVHLHPIGQRKHEAIGSHRGEHAQLSKFALCINPEHGNITKATACVAQHIARAFLLANLHHLTPHGRQRPRGRGLADAHFFGHLRAGIGAVG